MDDGHVRRDGITYKEWDLGIILVKLPKGHKVIGCDWVYRKKEVVSKKDGEKYKVRLIAIGYSHREGIDFNKIFSLVVNHTSIYQINFAYCCNAKC